SASGQTAASTAGYRLEPSVTTTRSWRPCPASCFRNRLRCSWSLRDTKAKATGKSPSAHCPTFLQAQGELTVGYVLFWAEGMAVALLCLTLVAYWAGARGS